MAEAGIDAAPEVLADQLLAPLAPDLYAFQRDELGRTRTELIAALTALTRVLAPDG